MNDQIVTVDPVLGVRSDDVPFIEQDMRDGAALRRLREALPNALTFEMLMVDYADDTPSHPRFLLRDYRNGLEYVGPGWSGATIAEAADKCREALEGK